MHNLKKFKDKFPKFYRFITEPRRFWERFRHKWFQREAKKLEADLIPVKPRQRFLRHWNVLTAVVLSVLLLVVIITLAFDIERGFLQEQKKGEEREKMSQEIQFWQRIVLNYQGYRDGYFQLAVLSYKIGNTQKAQDYLEKVFTIDPNFKEGRELEKLLTKVK